MSFIGYENNQCFLTDGHGKRSDILKVYDPPGNFSSLPTFETGGKFKYPVFNAVISIIGDFTRLNEGAVSALNRTEAHLCLLLITKALMKKHRDYTVLEIGCGDGTLSCSIARLLKEFNANSQLVCATDDMSGSCAQRWYEKLALSGAKEAASLLAAKYGSGLFPRNYFDIVVINGSAQFEEPAAIIYEAVNCLKNYGLLICVSANQFLLSSCFQVIAQGCTEYYLSNASSVFTQTVGKKDKYIAYIRTDEYKTARVKQEITNAFITLKHAVENLESADDPSGDYGAAVDDMIKTTARAEDGVLAIFGQLESRDIKFNISEFKESLVSYRLCHDEAERKRFASACGEKYQAVVGEMRKYSDFVI